MIAVVDYGIGNLRSAQKALEHLGAPAALTSDPDDVRRAAAIVLPGVGAFGRCMGELRARGLDAPVLDAIEAGTPFLAVCVGMQMLFEGSEEAEGVPGLGVLRGWVRRLPGGVTLPHMGWNTVEIEPGAAMFEGLASPVWMYFVHSYAPTPEDESLVVGRTHHGGPVVAAVERGSLVATQFHPEKSGASGQRLLTNFLAACGLRNGAVG